MEPRSRASVRCMLDWPTQWVVQLNEDVQREAPHGFQDPYHTSKIPFIEVHRQAACMLL